MGAGSWFDSLGEEVLHIWKPQEASAQAVGRDEVVTRILASKTLIVKFPKRVGSSFYVLVLKGYERRMLRLFLLWSPALPLRRALVWFAYLPST